MSDRISLGADVSGVVSAFRQIRDAVRETHQEGKKLSEVDFAKSSDLMGMERDVRRVTERMAQLRSLKAPGTPQAIRDIEGKQGLRVDAFNWQDLAARQFKGAALEHHTAAVGRFVLSGTRWDLDKRLRPPPAVTGEGEDWRRRRPEPAQETARPGRPPLPDVSHRRVRVPDPVLVPKGRKPAADPGVDSKVDVAEPASNEAAKINTPPAAEPAEIAPPKPRGFGVEHFGPPAPAQVRRPDGRFGGKLDPALAQWPPPEAAGPAQPEDLGAPPDPSLYGIPYGPEPPPGHGLPGHQRPPGSTVGWRPGSTGTAPAQPKPERKPPALTMDDVLERVRASGQDGVAFRDLDLTGEHLRPIAGDLRRIDKNFRRAVADPEGNFTSAALRTQREDRGGKLDFLDWYRDVQERPRQTRVHAERVAERILPDTTIGLPPAPPAELEKQGAPAAASLKRVGEELRKLGLAGADVTKLDWKLPGLKKLRDEIPYLDKDLLRANEALQELVRNDPTHAGARLRAQAEGTGPGGLHLMRWWELNEHPQGRDARRERDEIASKALRDTNLSIPGPELPALQKLDVALGHAVDRMLRHAGHPGLAGGGAGGLSGNSAGSGNGQGPFAGIIGGAAGGGMGGFARFAAAAGGVSTASQVYGNAQSEARSSDRLLRHLDDAGEDFFRLRERVRETGAALHLASGEAHDLSRSFLEASNERKGGDAAEGALTAGALARGFGEDPKAFGHLLGRARFLGEDTRRTAEITAETTARAGMNGEPREVVGAILRHLERANERHADPNTDLFAQAFASLNRNGTRGQAAEHLLNRADQGVSNAFEGTDARSHQAYVNMARLGITDPWQIERIREGGAFETVPNKDGTPREKPVTLLEADVRGTLAGFMQTPEGIELDPKKRMATRDQMGERGIAGLGRMLQTGARGAEQIVAMVRDGSLSRASGLVERAGLTEEERKGLAGERLSVLPELGRVDDDARRGDRGALEERRTRLLARTDLKREDRELLGGETREDAAKPFAGEDEELARAEARVLARRGLDPNTGRASADSEGDVSREWTEAASVFVPVMTKAREGLEAVAGTLNDVAEVSRRAGEGLGSLVERLRGASMRDPIGHDEGVARRRREGAQAAPAELPPPPPAPPGAPPPRVPVPLEGPDGEGAAPQESTPPGPARPPAAKRAAWYERPQTTPFGQLVQAANKALGWIMPRKAAAAEMPPGSNDPVPKDLPGQAPPPREEYPERPAPPEPVELEEPAPVAGPPPEGEEPAREPLPLPATIPAPTPAPWEQRGVPAPNDPTIVQPPALPALGAPDRQGPTQSPPPPEIVRRPRPGRPAGDADSPGAHPASTAAAPPPGLALARPGPTDSGRLAAADAPPSPAGDTTAPDASHEGQAAPPAPAVPKRGGVPIAFTGTPLGQVAAAANELRDLLAPKRTAANAPAAAAPAPPIRSPDVPEPAPEEPGTVAAPSDAVSRGVSHGTPGVSQGEYRGEPIAAEPGGKPEPMAADAWTRMQAVRAPGTGTWGLAKRKVREDEVVRARRDTSGLAPRRSHADPALLGQPAHGRRVEGARSAGVPGGPALDRFGGYSPLPAFGARKAAPAGAGAGGAEAPVDESVENGGKPGAVPSSVAPPLPGTGEDQPRVSSPRHEALTGAQEAIAPAGSPERAMMDLIGKSEGTDKGRGYDETLGYGRYTGGAVDLQGKSIREVMELQRGMLAHPENRWNSSAVGRYQIVGKTMRSLVKEMGLDIDATKFDAATQDAMAKRLMQARGMDPRRLAQVWASLPDPAKGGGGHYAGQRAHVSTDEVERALRGEGPVDRSSPPAGIAGHDSPLAPEAAEPIALAQAEPPKQSAESAPPDPAAYAGRSSAPAVGGGGNRPDVPSLSTAAPGLAVQDPVLPYSGKNTVVEPTPSETALPGVGGTPLPAQDRQGAQRAEQAKTEISGTFQVSPLRVEHVSAATGEVQGIDVLPVQAVGQPRPYGMPGR